MYYFCYALDSAEILNTNKYWNPLQSDLTSQAVVDETNQSTAITVTVPTVELFTNYEALNLPWTGEGAWFDENVNDPLKVRDPVYFTAATLNGVDSTKTYIVELVGKQGDGNRELTARVNGGTAQLYNLPADPDVSTIEFTVTGSTSIQIEVMGDGSSNGYLNGFRVYEFVPDPSVSVTQNTLTPGATFNFTYSNYETVPTTLTVSDGTNTITIASPTISDNGDGTGSGSGAMPALPTTGTESLVLFGDVTVELA